MEVLEPRRNAIAASIVIDRSAITKPRNSDNFTKF